MLGKTHRFHGYGSVRAVYSRGQTVRGGVLSLRYAKRPDDKPFRVAVVVSRKVNKSAVARNRIRRRVYEAVRVGSVQPAPGADLVFTVFDDRLAGIPAKQLQDMVTKLLQRAA